MKTVHVDITVHDEGALKVFWHEWAAYTISRKVVEGCAQHIRRSLLELVNAALEQQPGSYAPILKKLAEQGNLLYRALFTGIGGEEDPDRVRAHYERQAEPYQLHFRVSTSVFVPWGLVYPFDPSHLPDKWPDNSTNVNWEPYGDFWCLSKGLSTRYVRIKPDQIGDASTLDVIRVMHPETFEKAAITLSNCPEEGFLGWLKERYGPPITTFRALRENWREKGSRIGLLYFYCHASATKLALGDEEEIEANQLFLLVADPKRKPGTGCLVLINGCRTAVGNSKGDFLLSTSSGGLCGFVGTETDVPDIFALRFSISLLHLLFHGGVNLGEAMQRLYRDHFPLSLVYGLYAHPDFRMLQ